MNYNEYNKDDDLEVFIYNALNERIKVDSNLVAILNDSEKEIKDCSAWIYAYYRKKATNGRLYVDNDKLAEKIYEYYVDRPYEKEEEEVKKAAAKVDKEIKEAKAKVKVKKSAPAAKPKKVETVEETVKEKAISLFDFM